MGERLTGLLDEGLSRSKLAAKGGLVLNSAVGHTYLGSAN